MIQIRRVGPYDVSATDEQAARFRALHAHGGLPLEAALAAAGIQILPSNTRQQLGAQMIMPIIESKPGAPKPGVDIVMGAADLAVQAFYGGQAQSASLDIGRTLKGLGNAILGGVSDVLGGTVDQFTTSVTTGAQNCASLVLRPIEYAQCIARAAAGGISTTMGQSPLETIRNPLAGISQFTQEAFGRGAAAGTGMMGIPAVKPTSQTKQRLVCPRGLVLGTDNMCYMKGTIPRKWRKWRPDRKPPVTAGDAKAIRRAAGAKRRVRRLAGEVGLSTHARGAQRGPQKGKRR